MNLAAWAQELADTIGEQTLHAVTADPRNLTTPGVYLELARVRPDRLAAGVYSVDWTLLLVASPAGNPTAYDQLGALVADLEHAGYEVPEWSTVVYDNPNLSRDPLPALRGTLTTECE